MSSVPAQGARSRVLEFVPDILAAGLLCLWLAAKLTLLDALEYTSDLISNTQMSLSFLLGRPLLWENGFGNHKALHNYYLNPFLFPLTWLLGSPGLFVASGLLWAAAAAVLFSLARSGPAWKRPLLWAIAGAFLLGPVGFWFFDDPIYGWHTEYLYLPMAILFACSLARGVRTSWLIAVAIVLVREEGAIVVWSVHALFEWLRPAVARRPRLNRIARLTVLWSAVFAAGMVLQFFMRRAVGSSRLSDALGHVQIVLHDPILRHALEHTAETAAALVACGLIVGLAISWRAAVAALFAMLPLLPPLFIASCAYQNELGVRDYGFSWGLRQAMLWAVLAAGLVLSVALAERRPAFASARAALVVCAALISIAAQARILEERRLYPFWERVTAFLPERRHRFVLSRMRADEDALLRCLGRELPRWTPVSSGGSLFARFSRQDIVWPDRTEIAWAQPQLVACDVAQRLQYDFGCIDLTRRLEASGFSKLRVGGITVAYAEPLRQWVSRCESGR